VAVEPGGVALRLDADPEVAHLVDVEPLTVAEHIQAE
jgi:hypothetical protein